MFARNYHKMSMLRSKNLTSRHRNTSNHGPSSDNVEFENTHRNYHSWSPPWHHCTCNKLKADRSRCGEIVSDQWGIQQISKHRHQDHTPIY